MSTPSPSPSSNQKHFKFMFQANVKTVSLALKFPCVVSIIWKRGQKAQQVKQRKPIQKGIINFNQTLEIQCNMVFDVNKKVFEQKKTKFTILIFSQKGNKQAGQVYLDVAQLLNTKNKILQYEKVLQKCPDKNAKLSFSLQCYMKQQITPDMISQRSQKTYDIENNLLNGNTNGVNNNNRDAPANNNTNQQPDFKKKKNEALVVDDSRVNKQQKAQQGIKSSRDRNNTNGISQRNDNTTNTSSNNNKVYQVTSLPQGPQVVSISKQNMSWVKLQQQNRRLKQQVRQIKQLQLQNQNLKRKYQQADKKAQSYYKKKYQQMKQEYNQLKVKNQQVVSLLKKKDQLQLTICQCKQTIGKIFNYAIMNGNDKLMQMMEQFQ